MPKTCLSKSEMLTCHSTNGTAGSNLNSNCYVKKAYLHTKHLPKPHQLKAAIKKFIENKAIKSKVNKKAICKISIRYLNTIRAKSQLKRQNLRVQCFRDFSKRVIRRVKDLKVQDFQHQERMRTPMMRNGQINYLGQTRVEKEQVR